MLRDKTETEVLDPSSQLQPDRPFMNHHKVCLGLKYVDGKFETDLLEFREGRWHVVTPDEVHMTLIKLFLIPVAFNGQIPSELIKKAVGIET